MLKVKSFKVRSLDLDFHELSWEIENTTKDPLDYTFQLLRSESPEGPFEPLSNEFEDRYLFIDNFLQSKHRWRALYYKLLVRQKSDDTTKSFGPYTKEPEPDLIAIELRKHLQLLMREFAGRRCWLLPTRTFGPRCPNCWNEELQKRTRSGCLTCYDTGFLRGYLHPIETWIQIDPSPKADQPSNVGKLQQVNTTARMANYPIVKPRDIIIEGENRRWRIISQSQTEQGRAPVTQELQLHEIPQGDIEFRIPLKMDEALKDVFLNPPRNYTNPHNMQNFLDEEIPAIYDLYPSSYPKLP